MTVQNMTGDLLPGANGLPEISRMNLNLLTHELQNIRDTLALICETLADDEPLEWAITSLLERTDRALCNVEAANGATPKGVNHA